MVRAEPVDNRTAGIDAIMLMLSLLELNLLCEQRFSNCKLVPAEFLHLMAKYTLPFSKPVKSDHY